MSKHASISPEEAQTGLRSANSSRPTRTALTVAMRKVKCLCLSRTPTLSFS